MLIDFNKGQETFNKFAGSEAKTTVAYDGEVYMIKYPDPIREKKNVLSYMNNQYSEHIGCSIFRSCGMKTQDTALGYYTDINGKKKIVVGCKDFTIDGAKLYEFSKFGHQILVEGKPGVSIESVVEVVNRSSLIKDKEATLEKFWDMFVIDALIGNSDRHFDNWGILVKEDDVSFAPVYDCGSALAALLSDEQMEELMRNPVAFKNEEYNVFSCYYMDGKRIFYHGIFQSPPEKLEEAIKRIVPKIDMGKVHSIIDSVPGMSDTRKKYLKSAVDIRYEQILAPALRRLLKRDKKLEEKPSAESPAQQTLVPQEESSKDQTPQNKPSFANRMARAKQQVTKEESENRDRGILKKNKKDSPDR